MNYILFDSSVRAQLLPFTFTRPVADIRVGIDTLREKWEAYLKTDSSTQTEDYLSGKWPIKLEADNIFIDPSFIPVPELVSAIIELQPGQAIVQHEALVAFRHSEGDPEAIKEQISYDQTQLVRIAHTWDIFSKNHGIIAADFDRITQGRDSQPIPEGVIRLGNHPVFIEEGAKLPSCSLNTTDGPIYIGKNAEIMEGCLIRGPFALCEGAILKMGAKIYTGTTVGPYSKVGGEVNNSVLFAYSNKGHDGFLGNSVLGEWCNLGADTNTSNMKNNYTEVRLWDYSSGRFAPTGLQFCGLMMGDHSKTGINTMLNTGTVIGVSCNVFGSGYPRNFIPSFSWGSGAGMSTYRTSKAFETAEAMMKRRNVEFDQKEADILDHVFELTSGYRRY